jgi:hypothetical protein
VSAIKAMIRFNSAVGDQVALLALSSAPATLDCPEISLPLWRHMSRAESCKPSWNRWYWRTVRKKVLSLLKEELMNTRYLDWLTLLLWGK